MSPGRATPELRRIDYYSLVPGMVLPGHLRDRTGRVLIQAGTVLGPKHLDLLRERGALGVYAGADWHQPEADAAPPAQIGDPKEVLAALRGRRPERGQIRVRRNQRHAWSALLNVSIEERSQTGTRYRDLVVRTADISVRGFSFFYDHYIHPGTVVRAHFDMLPHSPCLVAVVRNCTHVSARQHRVGAEFVKVRRGTPVNQPQREKA